MPETSLLPPLKRGAALVFIAEYLYAAQECDARNADQGPVAGNKKRMIYKTERKPVKSLFSVY